MKSLKPLIGVLEIGFNYIEEEGSIFFQDEDVIGKDDTFVEELQKVFEARNEALMEWYFMESNILLGVFNFGYKIIQCGFLILDDDVVVEEGVVSQDVLIN